MSAPVAVVVVSWNTRELLKRCLDSLKADASAGLADVIVVDNASTDGSAALVAKDHGWARLIASEQNLGFGRAVNLGALSAPDADWIAAANADTVVTEGALGALLRAGAADPSAGALAPRLVYPSGETQHSVHPFPSRSLLLSFNLGRQNRDPEWGDTNCLETFWDPGTTRQVPWAVGAFLLIRRAAWDTVHGFDEGRFMYAEDLDLGWRLQQHGWKTRYVPEARVQHVEAAATEQAYGDAKTARWQRATYDWIAQTHGRRTATTLAVINTLGAAARVLKPTASRAERKANLKWMRLHASPLTLNSPSKTKDD
jgi:N-acetylglucosaminyl-diphospho-decaprenol L-rhamnosyltransferase